jgi:hypothetical protein
VTRLAEPDLYSTLGVAPSATSDEISLAFRARAKELHPDRHPESPDVGEQYKALTHAYNVLIRPTTRAQYDERRVGAVVRATASPRHEHAPVFRTVRSARTAVWSGFALFVLGLAGGVVLAGLDTGDAAKTITLWIVIAKLVICGVILSAVGRWRLRRLREPLGRPSAVTGR